MQAFYYIITFESSHCAIQSEKELISSNFLVGIMPTPKEISASCGLSLRIQKEDIFKAVELLKQKEIKYEKTYEITVTTSGKKIEEFK